MNNDEQIMKQLIEEAEKTLATNNYPVAAALVVDGDLVGVTSNRLIDHQNWASHAELLLLQEHSVLIRDRTRKLTTNPGKFTLYSTLEPCLMCLGAAVLHKISRIVYACPDPRGGAAMIDPKTLGSLYAERWPIIDRGPFQDASYQLVIKYIESRPEDFYKDILKEFKEGVLIS